MATQPAPAPPTDDYRTDLALWADTQAAHIRAGRWHLVDVDNVAEEIESLGVSQRGEVTSHLANVIEHLLKLMASAMREPRRGWWISVRRARGDIEDVLEENPSLRREMPTFLINARKRALRQLLVSDVLTQAEEPRARALAAALTLDHALTLNDDAALAAIVQP